MINSIPYFSPDSLPIVERYLPLIAAERMYVIEKEPIITPNTISVTPLDWASNG